MPQQFSVPALLKARLGNTLVVEETDDVGKEFPLGIDPLGISLQIQAANAQGTDAFSRLRIQPFGELDPRASLAQLLEQLRSRLGQGCSKQIHHILRRSYQARVITRKIEVARVSPEPKTDFIHRHQSTVAIDDRAALPQCCAGLGLKATGSGLQLTRLDHLQPSHPTHQTNKASA